MPNTWFRGGLVKRWYTSGGDARRGYFRNGLVFVREYEIHITGSDHNFQANNLLQWMVNYIGSWGSKDNTFRIVVHPGVQLVSAGTGQSCMWFGGDLWGNTFLLDNYGYILGRGGNGGNSNGNGYNGGNAIEGTTGCTLIINNRGVIGSGGGGGAAGRNTGNSGSGGGGGAPFGLGGSGRSPGTVGRPASFDTYGEGGPQDNNQRGVRGGYWGETPPNNSHTNSGYAGTAIVLGGGINFGYSYRGDIRGNAP